MDFKHIDKKYRPIPFWSWNERLSVEESVRQTRLMDEAGIGGYFMHARGGLQTEYMGEEWFDNVAACIEESNKRGMHPWAYDENGWPSGFGGGKVNGKGEHYWQKYLRVRPAADSREDIPENRIIHVNDTYCFFYEVNPFYVDTMAEDVIADFIKEVYQPYYDKFGTSFDGFFTDEPQISRNGIPWSLTLPQQYKLAYGEEIYDILPCLFYAEGNYEAGRVKFWKLVTELFSKNFMKQIHDFCAAHGIQFTGHMVLEENLLDQLTSNGACMPHYEYFDSPGMDWLGRNIFPCLTQHQLASAAAQTGKKQILSETFALCGHNVGHDELKRNYEWMMVRGINLMCQHLEGYSLRGIRKRDYPPAMYIQQPWWDEYKVFNDAMSRVGMLLAEGEIKFDTLLLHNMTSAWTCYNDKDNPGLADYNAAMIDAVTTLEAKHLLFHLGDEIMLERHARVEGDKLIVGEQTYTTLVIPEHKVFLENTEKLIAEFKANGGKVITPAEAPENPIIDSPEVTYTRREYPDFTFHYFVNSNNKEIKTKINAGGFALDIATGEKLPFDGSYTFPAYGSLVLIDDGTPVSAPIAPIAGEALDLSGDFEVVSATENALTLDKCDYWFDGVLQGEDSYVLNVANRAYALEHGTDIRCLFKANLAYLPKPLYLAVETPEIFRILVNGREIDKTVVGSFRDKAFRKIDITEYVTLGENTIELLVHFVESDVVYENLRKSRIFESEKNKLTYDMEIEAMYLVGDFGVAANGAYTPGERDASFFDGSFTIVEPPKSVKLQNIEKQGFPFFAGTLKVAKKLDLCDTNKKLAFQKKGINVVGVTVNGKKVDTYLWAPYEADLSDLLAEGENVVEFTLLNNLRNLLGPHHHPDGELYAVGPNSFFDEPCIWNSYTQSPFHKAYSFVETSILADE